MKALSACVGSDFFECNMSGVTPDYIFTSGNYEIHEDLKPGGGKTTRIKPELAKAATAPIVFLDEIFKADDSCLNPLLNFVGKGVAEVGGVSHKTPMRVLASASNELAPSGSNLDALWDRFQLRLVTSPIGRNDSKTLRRSRENLRYSGKSVSAPSNPLTLNDIDLLRQACHHVYLPDEIEDIVYDIIWKDLEGPAFTWLKGANRRQQRCLDVTKACALMAGRTTVGKADLKVLEWML